MKKVMVQNGIKVILNTQALSVIHGIAIAADHFAYCRIIQFFIWTCLHSDVYFKIRFFFLDSVLCDSWIFRSAAFTADFYIQSLTYALASFTFRR